MPHDLSAFKDAVGASSPVATELVTTGPVARLAATFGIETKQQSLETLSP